MDCSLEKLEPRSYLSGLSFSSTTYAVGARPIAATIADFNNDGAPDLAVANTQDGTASIMLNDGHGAFGPQSTLAIGNSPAGLAVTDLNSDGAQDLVALDNLPLSLLSIYFGNGNGAFGNNHGFAAGQYSTSIVAGDFNGDGKPDIVALGTNSAEPGTINLLLSNGDGTFFGPRTFATGGDPKAMAAADLNGDGRLDLVVVSEGYNYVQVFLGNGLGGFTPGQTLATQYAPAAVAVGDLNGDGAPDLVVTNLDNSSVSVFLNNGNGTFQLQQTFATGGYGPSGVAIADFSGDHKNDIVVANENSNNVGILLGNGNGTFQAPQTFYAGSGPSSVGVSDLNGDGEPDVVVSDFAGYGVDVLLNTYAAAPSISQNGGMVTGMGTMFGDTESVSVSGGNVIVTIDGMSDSMPMGSVTGIVLDPGAGNDSVNLGAGLPPVTVGGAGGNDTVVTANDNDSLRGGSGEDLISAGAASGDTAVGGAGNDTISAGGTGQALFGGPGDDVIINGGGSGDTVNGGAGMNFAEDNPGDSLTNIFEIYDPNPNAASPGLVSDTVTDTAGGTDLQVFGTSGNDSITMSDDGLGDLVVTENGGAPQDFSQAGLAAVLLAGGLGNDTLSVDSSVTLPVSLRGAKGDDSLTGGGGDNVIVGGAGNDTLQGGSGQNLLVPTRRVVFEDGSADFDILKGGPAGSENYADFSHRTDNLLLVNDGVAHGSVKIMPNVQNIFGGTGMDTVESRVGEGFLSAGYGQDSIASGGSNTILVAGPAGAGSDTIVGNGTGNGFYLLNGHQDDFSDTVVGDIIQSDLDLDTVGG